MEFLKMLVERGRDAEENPKILIPLKDLLL